MSITTEKTPLIDRLFKAGSHFGFKKARRHPTVAPFLFTTKDGNDIFDLEKTALSIEKTKEMLKEAGLQGKTVLLVGTKDEVSRIVKAVAEKVATPYVTNRWIGGMLTNFAEMKRRINRLEELNAEKESGELERKYTKKERVLIGREVAKLDFNFSGISSLKKMPDYILVVDPRHDSIAVTEARDKKIPVIAIMSSDCDVAKVKFPIVANDSLQTSVSLILNELTASYAEGKSSYTPTPKSADSQSRVSVRRKVA
ncbi:30S ribosomal protein S2 [Candidatus Kaiserbacteria bacterium]|nr:30S ribosomal protein S2 [Candidatus Kaiserbacteria bacterium]USN91863.1 MAG: 30S ribosomal protein S2 [Candidatus Nomurabacteria bacterium]